MTTSCGMRLAGYSHRTIVWKLADEHGIITSRPTVTRDINARIEGAAAACPATAEYRELHRLRLERLLQEWWPQAINGNTKGFDRVLALLKRQARLLGLDMPLKTELSGPDGGPVPISVDSLIDRITESLADA